MPRVPTLDTRQVAPTIRPMVQESAAQQPEAVVASVLGTIGQVAQEARQRANAIRLNEAEVEARRLRSRILLDPKTGVLNRQRQAAFDAPEVAGREWDAGVSQIAQGLAPDQRQAFIARANQIRAEIEDQTFRHVRNEMDKVDKENTEALTTQLLNDAVENAGNDAIVSQNLTRAEGLVRERLARLDVTDQAVIDAEIGKVRSDARSAQIDALLRQGNVTAAKAVYEANANALTPERRTRFGNAIREAEQGTAIAREATRILAASDRPTERNAMIAELPIEMRKGVRSLVEAEQNAVRDAQKLEQETAFTRLETAVQQGIPLSDPRLAQDLAVISTSQRQTLDRYVQAPTNDNKAWLEWYQLSLDPKNVAKLSESEFRAYWSRLSTSHRDDAERAYREAKQTASGPEGARSYVTPQTVVARAMRTLGGVSPFASLSDIPEQKQPMVAQFEMRAAEELASERQAKGRDLTPSEMQAVVDRMQLTFVREAAVDPVRIGNLQYGTGRTRREESRAFQMTPSDTTGIFAGTTRIKLDQIPSDAITTLDRTLQANGVPTTDANREALYTIQQFDVGGERTKRWLTQNRR